MSERSQNEAPITPHIRRAKSPSRFSTVKPSSSSSSVNALSGTLGAPTLETNAIQREPNFHQTPVHQHETETHETLDLHGHHQYRTEPLGEQPYRGQLHPPNILPEAGHLHVNNATHSHQNHAHTSPRKHGHEENGHHQDHHQDHTHGRHEHGHHHGHDHHDHEHDHHHGHGHGHDHDHSHGDGHDHHYHHEADTPSNNFPPLSSVLKNLSPPEKQHLLWSLINFVIGMSTFVYGHTVESIAFVGLGYLEIFDALGLFNGLYSQIARTRNVFKEAGPGYPYGAQRYEVLYALVNAIYLLFTAIYMCKEGLEHMLMPHHKEEFEGGISVVAVAFVSVCATLYSAVQYQNHRQLCLLQNPHTSAALDQAYYRKDVGAILRYNQYVRTTIGCAIGVGVLFSVASQPALSGLDPSVALVQGAVMFYLAGPTAKALARVLLQGTPEEGILDVDRIVKEITSWSNVVSCKSPHFWTNSFGNLVGTIEINVSPTANEQDVLAHVRRLFGDVVKDVTVQVMKDSSS